VDKILAFLDGKKTYIVTVLIFVHAGVMALGYTIPEWIYMLEAAAGLGAVRSAISKPPA
jgi:hypothetical protein